MRKLGRVRTKTESPKVRQDQNRNLPECRRQAQAVRAIALVSASPMLVSSLFKLPDDLQEAVVGWAWSTRELARLAASHSRFRHIVRRLLRDRSHPIWRQLCANAGGGAVFDGVAD